MNRLRDRRSHDRNDELGPEAANVISSLRSWQVQKNKNKRTCILAGNFLTANRPQLLVCLNCKYWRTEWGELVSNWQVNGINQSAPIPLILVRLKMVNKMPNIQNLDILNCNIKLHPKFTFITVALHKVLVHIYLPYMFWRSNTDSKEGENRSPLRFLFILFLSFTKCIQHFHKLTYVDTAMIYHLHPYSTVILQKKPQRQADLGFKWELPTRG